MQLFYFSVITIVHTSAVILLLTKYSLGVLRNTKLLICVVNTLKPHSCILVKDL